MAVTIYIETSTDVFERIEMYEDEEVIINSSVQNVNDISKVFSDFSQSFTIPTTPTNNAIFSYFYESDVVNNVDHNIRKNARIEIDLIPFRTGKVQMEKAKLNKGNSESYTITFYGDVRTLKDYFDEDKLNVLDYSAYDHTYDGSQVQNRINLGTNYDVRYPLISGNNLWTYGDAGAFDVSVTPISYTELFPAIKLKAIFNEIESYYGITFQGLFLDTKRFTQAFLYCKNALTRSTVTETKIVDITSETFEENPSGLPAIDTVFDLGTNKILIDYNTDVVYTEYVVEKKHILDFSIYDITDTTATWTLFVYVNNQLFTTRSSTGNDTVQVFEFEDEEGLSKEIYFKIRADKNMTFKSKSTYTFFVREHDVDLDIYTNSYYYNYGWGSAQTIIGSSDIASFIPDMKVTDFFAGILKQFNLVCYGVNETTFVVEPLEDWYAKGTIENITPYTDVENIEVERVPLYKKIAFEHEKSESFLNREFAENSLREYGDLSNVYPYDGKDYTVKVPFENLLFTKFTNTSLQVGFCLKQDLKAYVPKPIILYLYDDTTIGGSGLKFNNGVTTDTLTNYYPFGQDMRENNINYSLNFGADNSSLVTLPIQNSIYTSYYSGYINNLYTKQNRLTKVKCVLPLPILYNLKLNDRLVIRDKRYVINDMKMNLVTKEVDLVLLNDFRPIRLGTGVIHKGKPTIVYQKPFLFGKLTKSASINVGTSGVVAVPSTFTEETIVALTIPANTTEKFLRETEEGEPRVTEDIDRRRSEEGEEETLSIEVTYTNLDGSTELQTIYINSTALS